MARELLAELQQRASLQEERQVVDLVRLRRLINDGKRVNIVPQEFEPVVVDDTLQVLSAASQVDLATNVSLPDFGTTINRLREEQGTLREALEQTSEELRAARLLMSEQSAYSRERSEQRARLSAIGLFKSGADLGHACPVCESELAVPTPASIQIEAALSDVTRQLESVELEQPHLQRHLEQLTSKRDALEKSLVETQASLARAIAEDERARAQQDILLERARVVGRIGAFIDGIRPPDVAVDLVPQIEAAKRRVQALEAAVDIDEIAQKTDTYLNLISKQMSIYAEALDLEHSGSALRLDLKKLTVVADTDDGPIPLNRMGSGENWVGYHVLTYLALHWWFRKRDRPVPGVLIFDQPSQAHYPAERDQEGSLDPLEDKDRHAVHALFELMHRECQVINGLQLIVLDHAHLNEDWFERAIVEEWRRGRFLVPPSWYA